MKKHNLLINTNQFEGGPALFRSRLISSFQKYKDINIIYDNKEKFDIELVFIRRVYKHDKPCVLRIDGCYYEKNKGKNNKILEDSISKSNYLIFQSKFSFNLCKNILNIDDNMFKRSLYSIIYNGIDLDYINSIKKSDKIEPGSFVCCAGWRSNKRPLSTIKGFLEANTKRHLYVIGGSGFNGKKIDKKYNSKYIHILGERSNEEVISIMKSCDYQIHLCHIDSCPNSVIEGLCCGLNVLCTNLGGTPELVKDNGIILDIDKNWEGKYFDCDNLDNIPSSVVAKGICDIIKNKKVINSSNFDINKVSLEYVNIIRKICGK